MTWFQSGLYVSLRNFKKQYLAKPPLRQYYDRERALALEFQSWLVTLTSCLTFGNLSNISKPPLAVPSFFYLKIKFKKHIVSTWQLKAYQHWYGPFYHVNTVPRDFLDGPVVKTSSDGCRRCKFNLWLGN